MHRLAAFLLSLSLAAAPALAAPTTKPATRPATAKVPTPAELIKRLKAMDAEQAALVKVAVFDLSEPIAERQAQFALFGDGPGEPLFRLLDRIRQAREDDGVKAVLVLLNGATVNLAQAQEIRDALAATAAAGKRVFAYADSYDTTLYTIATGATDVCVLGGGEIMIPGVGLDATFAKGLLDKVGVQADYVQIGEYKGAEEPFTRTSASPELKQELSRLVDSLYDQIVRGIVKHRRVTREVAQQLIDDTLVSAKSAKERGLVDHLIDADGLRDLLADAVGGKVNLLTDFAETPRPDVDVSSPFGLLKLFAQRTPPANRPTVAVITADGTIIDGEAGESLFGGANQIGSEDLRKALRSAARDEHVKAIVLRIDSPGGSALASEAMWQAARRAAKQKPLVVSIGGMAASGGYYLASAGDYVFADPTSIVGSIGVVGGKFVTRGLFDKLGVTTEPFRKGANAGLFSSDEPFTDRQRQLVTAWMKQTYAQFTDRILTTRRGKIIDIDKVARGRLFVAQQAKDLGMVDMLGGVEAAITDAAEKANLEAGDYDVRAYPGPKTLADLLLGGGSSGFEAGAAQASAGRAALAQLVGPDTAAALANHVEFLTLLRQRPVVLVSPYVITVR